MNNKYTEVQKQSALELFANGEAVSTIVASTGIPRSTIYSWIKASRDKKNKKDLSLRNLHYLENKVKRLEGIIEIPQKVNCRATDSLDIKLNALEELYGQYNVHMLCEAFKVPRGTFYNHIPYDNSVMESFFFNLKREELYRTKYRSESKFRAAVDKYMIFYNEQRPHTKNGYKTPLKKELDYYNSQAALSTK